MRERPQSEPVPSLSFWFYSDVDPTTRVNYGPTGNPVQGVLAVYFIFE
ncbi:MAG: hypothetical protein SFX72_10890 [Isosphaeraceae bacterium]|nr:hypothetical protein [Isosphaeraceae bacterium]